MFHGAALTQIAEHDLFTAINSLTNNGSKSRSSFWVNKDIGIFLKYARKANASHQEFPFNFTQENIREIEEIHSKLEKVFLIFVCAGAKEICCISYDQFTNLLAFRKKRRGIDEDKYTILVTVPSGKSCRVYMNVPGRKNTKLGEIIIPRNDFPSTIFT